MTPSEEGDHARATADLVARTVSEAFRCAQTTPVSASPRTAQPTAAPSAGSFALGDFTIWGIDGDAVTAADFTYNSSAKTLTVNTDAHFAIQNTDQTKVASGAEAGRIANPSSASIVVPAGRNAFMAMEGLGIEGDQPVDIKAGGSLTIILGDGTRNELCSTNIDHAALHCPTGASLIIDDTTLNRTADGRHIVPENGKVPYDCTLSNGKAVSRNDPLSTLESNLPGELYAWAPSGALAAGIGSNYLGTPRDIAHRDQDEPAGNMTFDGGLIVAKSGSNTNPNSDGAGIGSGRCGPGTGLNEWITINGGRISAQGAYHGAGIGSGAMAPSGNIRINGGFVESLGGNDGNGFGGGCSAGNSSAYQLILTGGTLLPTGSRSDPIFNDVGAPGLQVVVTGGSMGNQNGVADFRFDGTAKNDRGEAVTMVEVNLTSDVGTSAYPITKWQLLVDGEPYDYGAPAEFDKGHLYLWLPEIVKQNSEVTVEFTYLDTDKLDENGNPTPVTPLPLFRPADSSLPPGVTNDGKLRRYVDFTLDADYLASLDKYYDGKGAGMFPLPLRTPDGRDLTEAEKITFRYQHLDSAGNPVGAETGDGSDVGTMKFTAISTQYSDDTEGNFSESYWGHRATGQFTIWPIASQVSGIAAEWVDDGDPGDVAHPSDQVLKVSATIGAAPTVDGQPGSEATKPTCQAPRGQVQIYVDGQPVGAPVDLVYAGDPDAEGNPIPEGDPRVTAERVENGQGGSTARFSLARAASASDFLVPTQGQQGRHEIALRFLPPSAAQAAAGQPANYLASADPAEDPSVPRAEVAIDPIDPATEVIRRDDPDNKDPDSPVPDVSAGAPRPADPGADPAKPGDKIVDGAIVTTWGEPSADNPHPGRVVIDIKTESSGPVSVVDQNGDVFEADFLRGEDGEPVRNADGSYTLVLDPAAVGSGKLSIRQEPNGAFTGTTWNFDVTVLPQPKIAPAPALSKRAENLTHPNGPTQPGDRIRYTIEASNGAAGSLWTDAVVTDPLPACLELDEGSVRLDNPSAAIAGKALEKAASVAAGDVGKFSLSAPGAGGRPVLTVPVGNVAGGASATVTFECTVRADAAGEGTPAADLANVAQATGTRPDPADPERPMPDPDNPGQPLPVNPDPTDPATPPGPGRVVPADPVVDLTKTVENVTAPDAGTTHIGDVLRYTVTLANTGAANSCLVGAVVSDPLPVGLDPVAGTLRLAVDGGAPVAVPDAAYDRASRTIAVTCGDMWGGSRAVLTFDATVGAEAAGADNGNVAHAHGSVPSKDPGTAPTDPEPGRPATPPSEEPETSTPPVLPPTVVPDDPDRGDVTIEKTAENTSRDDGTTHVGDTVRYRVELANGAVGTGWMDAVIRDDVPEGLEPVAGTLRLTLPDGSEVAVDDAAYDPATRILAVACGHLYGGQRVTLAFDALVTEAAVGADIGNVAVGLGTPPSAWDPDGESPEPGAPFDPPEGWDAYERSRGEVASGPAYPPGVDRLGGVVPGDLPREKERTTIAHKLAQTGDALAAAALLPAALALAAGAALLASRRRRARSPR
ncbi:hypothetical protein [Adlercreutzia muris]|nr:hypothetical protein [Adlercreutzia muris]